MRISNNEYSKMVDKASPNSPVVKNCVKAFLFGGGICGIAQIMYFIFERAGFNKEQKMLVTQSILIVLTAILTGIGVFDNIARHAGAGTIVPITGFANSVVSPALEFKQEGMILGTGAQMFTIAGPVLVYGVSSSVIYGLIYYLTNLIK